uniref:Ribonuclease P protein component 2 n=1 Tax=Caenorhabditis tropicalis TaxID=1561998 RepID=A0A1I7TP27_9PELO
MLSIFTIIIFLCTVYLYVKVNDIQFRDLKISDYIFDSSNEPILFNHTHAFITSAYYYQNSKSLGKNALAMVVVMSQKTFLDLEKYEMTIVGTRGTRRLRSKALIKKFVILDSFLE